LAAPSRSPPEARVRGWSELNEALYADSWREHLGRFRSGLAYRGQPDASAAPETGLRRLGGDLARQERSLLRSFRKYAMRSQVAWPDSVWNWLAVGQHYGLPTRLLDWTYSPLVACHFATDDPADYGRDGAILCLDYTRARCHLPAELRAILDAEDADVFTVEMLSQAGDTLDQLDQLTRDPFLVFLEPPSIDDRIVNQYALFSLMSSPTAELDCWTAEHPELCRRIVIPADLKWEVRDKLDQANVSERVLFPGLDGLTSWLKRYYMVPKHPRAAE
jgi:hypothetical protein